MKLSTREIVLLSIVGILAIAVGVNKLILAPQLETVSSLRMELASLESLKTDILAFADDNGQARTALREQEDKIRAITDKYYPELIQERMYLVVDDIMRSSGLQIASMSVSQPTISSILSKTQASARATFPLDELAWSWRGTPAPRPPATFESQAGQVWDMTARLPFRGSYTAVLDFLRQLQSHERQIVISDISMSGSGDSVSGTINLHFYGIPSPVPEDEEYLIWEASGQFGRSNPFTW